MNLQQELIKNVLIDSLTPKFEDKIIKSNIDKEKAKQWFLAHIEVLSIFLYNYYANKETLEILLFKDFHKLFYPSNYKILVSRNGILYENIPWEWRKQEYNPQIKTSKFTRYSENIENDFIKLVNDYNLITNKRETDIVKFFFDFLSIHPFWDSNLTIISIIMDLELLKYGYKFLNILKIRFVDHNFFYFLFTYYQKNIERKDVLEEILSFIKDFNNWSLSNELIEEKNKQEVYNTSKLF